MKIADSRYLIVNADDFGISHGVNVGVIEAFERGILTSASLMVRWPAALEAANYAIQHRTLSCGLHFDFGEWTYRDGTWEPLYVVVDLEDERAVEYEAERQLELFEAMVGRGPSHLDSHQHVARRKYIGPSLESISRRLGVPLRGRSGVTYCGAFYGQTDLGSPHPAGIAVAALCEIVSNLSPGITELGCHPGRGEDVRSMYVCERSVEVDTLCHPAVRSAIDDSRVTLRSFHDVTAG